MKKIKQALKRMMTMAVMLLLTACEGIFDSLSENPDRPNSKDFYTTSENINKGIMGIYSYISTPRAMGASGIGLMCNRGDEGSARSDYGSPGQYTAALTSSYYTIVQPYQLFYTAGFQACQMIEVIPGVKFTNEELKKAYLGEAHFLRAFAHFFLLLHYRNIPLMKQMPASAIDYRPQASPEEAWNFICEDLEIARGLLPLKGFWDKNYAGRVTKAAATALLGKVYLYRSGIEKYYSTATETYYDEAAACFDKIIGGADGDYFLVDNYNDNFDIQYENNDESIFEIQFLGDAVHTAFNPGTIDSGVWRDPRGFNPPTTKSAQDQVMHDWVYDSFVHSKDADGNTDSRMFGTLIFDDRNSDIHAKEGDRVTLIDGVSFQQFYHGNGFADINAMAGKYKACGRKGLDWSLPGEDPGSKMYFWNLRANGLNYTYIRYADVLLMYAEAVVSGGKQGSITPLDAINRVRTRKSVALPQLSAVDMDIIERERILELTHEGHRFFDLLRWGRVAKRFHELEEIDLNFKQYGQSAYLGFQEGKHEWLPIPIDEVEGNPY